MAAYTMTTAITGNLSGAYPDGLSTGTSATSLNGFYGATPVVQPAATAQSAVATTAITTVITTGSTSSSPFGFATSAQADAIVAAVNSLVSRQSAIITLENQIRSDLVTLGLIKGAA